jgi:8-hydroxy-5-deazaflavin:NADPH oxidoreductase
MRIAVIGVGGIGSALASLFARHGHPVVLGTRRREAVEALARELGAVAVRSYRDAALDAEALCFCASWEHAESVLAELGDVGGRVMIDTTNPETPDGRALAIGHSISGAERVAAWLPSARVVKAFNYVYAELLLDAAAAASLLPSIFLSGDDPEAREQTAALVASCGLEAIDCGPLINARYLEPLALLMVQLVRERGWPAAAVAMRLAHG